VVTLRSTIRNAATVACALEGRRNKIGAVASHGPASLPGRKIVFDRHRWLRCAPPPANFRCASGALVASLFPA